MMIEIKNLSKAFRRTPVLDDLSLGIERRERIALVGSNGAGKTTLIRCLLGEYTHEGSVTIDGVSPREDRPGVLSRIGFVPQLPPPLGMPVGELIRFSSGVTGTDPARIEELTERLGLELDPIRKRPFVKLSGGQKQKLLIGIALGRGTDILVLDEPAANLDPAARATLFELLAERPEATMLISSHRLDEVAPLVNRVIELDLGKVVLDDRVADEIDLTGVLSCQITIERPEEAFAKTIGRWGFTNGGDGTRWTGRVVGPDRLRFLGTLSRYAGLVTGLVLEERPEERDEK